MSGRLDDLGLSRRGRRGRRCSALLPRGLAAAAAALALAHGPIHAAPDAPGGSASLTYALCKSNLASLQILTPRGPDDPFAIAAQLGRPAAEELEGLTEQNVGGTLEIVVGDWLFLRGPIRTALPSGLLVNRVFTTREQAESWLDKLRSALPEGPCGPEA